MNLEYVLPLKAPIEEDLDEVRHARHEYVVIADDDVRWDRPSLQQAVRLLHQADPGAAAEHLRAAEAPTARLRPGVEVRLGDRF